MYVCVHIPCSHYNLYKYAWIAMNFKYVVKDHYSNLPIENGEHSFYSSFTGFTFKVKKKKTRLFVNSNSAYPEPVNLIGT